MIRVKVDAADAVELLGDAPESVQRAMDRWLPQAGLHVRTRMQQFIEDRTSHRATGALKRSIQSRVAGNAAVVESDAPYAPFVNYPTIAHTIEPRLKQALAFPPFGASRHGAHGFQFQFGGRTTRTRHGSGRSTSGNVVVKRVHHPGTRGLLFLEATEADVASSGDLERLLDVEIARELGGAS